MARFIFALNSETKGFPNSSRLAMLRRGAILVNTARGALVDEAAFVEALRTNWIAHAALTFFETEPPEATTNSARYQT